MGRAEDTCSSDRTNGNSAHWQETIQLLRLMQRDYQGARKQLDNASHALAEREVLVDQRLQYALLASGGYQTLCLVTSGVGITGSQMGKAILGEISEPATLPDLVRLEVRCLGKFQVRSTWKQVERWQSVKARSVFQYLVTRPTEPTVKDMLMEALWPECTPRAAANNLKAAVHGIRRTLSPLFDEKNFPYVLFSQGSYRLNPAIELWLDVEEFERHWTRGRDWENKGKLAEAIEEFKLAEVLYQGDYLEDEPYEEWTILRREALKDTYLTILGKLADHSMLTADYESSIIYCQRILTRDSCREDAYRRLMRCHSRLGRRNRALRWYEICRKTIKAELDTTPDHETTTLYHRLQRDELI